MPFCPECGTTVKPENKFCPNCGQRLEPVAPPQQRPAAYAPQPAQEVIRVIIPQPDEVQVPREDGYLQPHRHRKA